MLKAGVKSNLACFRVPQMVIMYASMEVSFSLETVFSAVCSRDRGLLSEISDAEMLPSIYITLTVYGPAASNAW